MTPGKLQVYAQLQGLGRQVRVLETSWISAISSAAWGRFSPRRPAREDREACRTCAFSGEVAAADSEPVVRPLADVEQRYRQRYVDLIVSEDARKVLLLRSKIVGEVRRFFEAKDFIEVETPMMQTIAGGAAARPFVTRHNALNIDLYPAHCAGALSQAAAGRRHDQGIRDQPKFPQRRHFAPA